MNGALIRPKRDWYRGARDATADESSGIGVRMPKR
jgi:hypothetical protein